MSNTELCFKKVGGVTVLHMEKGIPGSGDCVLRDPKRGEGHVERERGRQRGWGMDKERILVS